ncbi:DMT family transporter [Rhabdaerophilum calidifontis]|uniref:aromatic amino acid exporter YddG n=1 Tax=Rhabdaerophilum calidifontis TaxID=2604328 RepID=UPI00123B08F0|nr:DMT family transporter [Rhabdaerophilum calidifontis]
MPRLSLPEHVSLPTLAGLGAILLWGLLALLTDLTAGVPPFLLTALTFAIGGGLGLALVALRGGLHRLRQPPAAWALGLGGLFGYHAVYFAALKAAPAAEASLIAYLWPLLIVLFSGLLPGERLGARPVFGALLGFSGVALLALAKGGFGAGDAVPLLGYGLALACAFIWSGYSVLSRRMSAVPTEAVAGFCLATALLAALAHLALEPAHWPAEGRVWGAILLLGLGPVGAAFFLWDLGMKRGDIRFLGTASYAAPVISTLALVAAGRAAAGWPLALACALIVGGAVIARPR